MFDDEVEVEEVEEQQEEQKVEEVDEFKLFGKYDNVYVMDFEAFTKNDEGDSIEHEPYTVHYADFNRQYYDGRGIQSFIKHIINLEYKNVLVYIHNLSYDCTFILNQKNVKLEQILDPQGRMVQFSAIVFKGDKYCKVTFRDSLRMISEPLCKLPGMFLDPEQQKSVFKELMCYDYYTKSRYILNRGNITEALKSFKHKEVSREDFVTSLKNAGAMIDDDTFNMQKFADYYCKQDCRVLLESLMKFQ